MFNVECGVAFDLDADLPIDGLDWTIGVVHGPSGSGKSSIGRAIWGPDALWSPDSWPADAALVDSLAPADTFDAVTSALSAVGLGSVPTWLRPYAALSTGEQFRANMARLLLDRPARVVVDEFTSVVDRQVARLGSHAFARAWRRTGGQVVLLTCHEDVLDWIEPDWTFDTSTGRFAGRWLQRRPCVELEIVEADWSYWPSFEPHHYLKANRMIAATPYLGLVDGRPVAHAAVTTTSGLREGRMARIVVLPEWQGIGIGARFVDAIAAAWRRGRNRYATPMTTIVNTGHPGLIRSFRTNPLWVQVSCTLFGSNKERSHLTLKRSAGKCSSGFGGHFRAMQGFRYVEGI